MTRGARGPRAGGGGKRRTWPTGVLRLTPASLRWECDPQLLAEAVAAEAEAAAAEAKTLAEQIPDPARRARWIRRRRLTEQPHITLDELVGQERASDAIVTGLSSEAPGFHVYVCGQPGSGRRALVRAALERYQPPFPRPKDRVYVGNFQHPERPRLLTLPRGKGSRFRRDLDEMLTALRQTLPAALNSEQHLAKCERIRRRSDSSASRVIDDLAAELRRDGLIVGALPEGYATPELRIDADTGGEPLSPAVVRRRIDQGELRETREVKERLAAYDEAKQRLEDAAGEARAIARRGGLAIRRLDARVAKSMAQGFADDLAKAYPTEPIRRWLDMLLEEVGNQVELFLEGRDDEDGEEHPTRPEHMEPFRANLFVDAKEYPVPPLVMEPNPTHANLCGGLDTTENIPEHMRLRAGSLLRANGGVLVTNAAELFHDRAAWGALKRTVKSGFLEMQRGGERPGGSLRPDPIRTALKLVVIGTEEMYEAMNSYDPEFASVFKVKAQLEETIPRSDDSIRDLGRGLLRVARRAGLKTPQAGALARLLEHACRRAGRIDKLRLCFAELLDVMQEADRLATAGGRKRKAAGIRAQDVEQAMARKRLRHDLPERQAQEMIDEGIVLLESQGQRVGVVNALVVYDEGGHTFSRPTRVTATTGMGRKGLVDIEREARFSGDSHHKGVEIVAGFLRERYSQDKPLCLTASVCFEQSYSMVDGDSASLAEVLAVLSCLSDLPLEQSWGVTGSINQKGDVQAVGDVNTKIEGYFDTCLANGLTGQQGVIFPEANARDLMLRRDLVKAVAKGRFHVVAVRALDDALELLAGVTAGTRPSPFDPYPDGTANALADERLRVYAEAAARFERR